jgi:hypothetical protein
MNKFLVLYCLCFSFTSATSWALATSSTSVLGANSTATAGAGHAIIDTSEAPSLNPASIPFTKGYFLNTDYSFLNNGNGFNIALTDNLIDTVLPTSVIYTQINGKTALNQDFVQQQGQLEFANFYRKSLSIGLGGRYQADSVFQSQWTQTNLFMGAIYSINSRFNVALVFDNLLNTDSNIPVAYRLNPGTSAGVAYNYMKIVRLRADVSTATNNSMGQPTLSAGAESFINKFLVIRAGVNKNYESNMDGSGAGIGFIGPKFSLNYGYFNCTEDQRLSRQAVDFAVPVW